MNLTFKIIYVNYLARKFVGVNDPHKSGQCMKTGKIPLDSAKNLIVSALDHFEPSLGVRAAAILFDQTQVLDGHARLNIIEFEKGSGRVMMCRPAGLTNEDVIGLGLYIADFAKRFGPHFTRQDNPTDQAVVDFEYDRTYGASVWLAHEVGHAIADDIQKEHGHCYKDFTPDEMEKQAYFVQKIYSQYLREKLGINPQTADQEFGEDVSNMSSDRIRQFREASAIVQNTLSEPVSKREIKATAALDQRLIN